MIVDEEPYYQGHNVLQLARTKSFEAVTALLWDDESPLLLPWAEPPGLSDRLEAFRSGADPQGLPLHHLFLATSMLAEGRPTGTEPPAAPMALLSAQVEALSVGSTSSANSASLIRDPSRPRASAANRVRSGDRALARRVIQNLLPPVSAPDDDTAAHRLRSAGHFPHAVHLVNAALVLSADHGLAVPTVMVRLITSLGGSLPRAVTAGLSGIRGQVTGATSLAAESFLHEASAGRIEPALERRLVGGPPSWCGHVLYPHGDPRAVFLLRELLKHSGNQRLEQLARVLDAMKSHGLPAPNIDFALAAVSYGLGLRRGSGEALFSIGRTAGWTAHHLEELREPRDFRPTGVYVGPWPTGKSGDSADPLPHRQRDRRHHPIARRMS
jgi:citrate synthase